MQNHGQPPMAMYVIGYVNPQYTPNQVSQQQQAAPGATLPMGQSIHGATAMWQYPPMTAYGQPMQIPMQPQFPMQYYSYAPQGFIPQMAPMGLGTPTELPDPQQGQGLQQQQPPPPLVQPAPPVISLTAQETTKPRIPGPVQPLPSNRGKAPIIDEQSPSSPELAAVTTALEAAPNDSTPPSKKRSRSFSLKQNIQPLPTQPALPSPSAHVGAGSATTQSASRGNSNSLESFDPAIHVKIFKRSEESHSPKLPQSDPQPDPQQTVAQDTTKPPHGAQVPQLDQQPTTPQDSPEQSSAQIASTQTPPQDDPIPASPENTLIPLPPLPHRVPYPPKQTPIITVPRRHASQSRTETHMRAMRAVLAAKEENADDDSKPIDAPSDVPEVVIRLNPGSGRTMHNVFDTLLKISPIYTNDGFKCPHCDKIFKFRKHCRRHMVNHSGAKPFKCPTCLKTYTRKDTCQRHVSYCQPMVRVKTRTRHV